MRTWILVIGLIALFLGLLICNDQKHPSISLSHETDSLKSKIKGLEEEAARKDTLFADSIREIEVAKTVKVTEFKTRLVYVRDTLERLPITNDTIQMLVRMVEQADSIIDLDSAEIQIWKHRYENQVSLYDSVGHEWVKIEDVYFAQFKSQKREIRKWKVISYITGAVAAGVLLLR